MSIISFFITSSIFCQTYLFDESQIRKVLIDENAFGKYLKFNQDNTFVSSFRTWGGDGYHIEGSYQIDNGIISFFNVNDNQQLNSIHTDNNGYLNFNHKFKYSPDMYNIDYLGCLVDLSDNNCFWSVKEIPAEMIIEVDGIKVKRNYTNGIYITENLRMRDAPNLEAETVFIKGADYDFGYVSEKRKVVFAGTVIPFIAETVEQSTIDGITAPWYYIKQFSHDSLGRNEGDEYYVWIFGGYTKLCGKQQSNDYEEVLKSVKNAGFKMNNWEY